MRYSRPTLAARPQDKSSYAIDDNAKMDSFCQVLTTLMWMRTARGSPNDVKLGNSVINRDGRATLTDSGCVTYVKVGQREYPSGMAFSELVPHRVYRSQLLLNTRSKEKLTYEIIDKCVIVYCEHGS